MPYTDKVEQNAAVMRYKMRKKAWLWSIKRSLKCEICGFHGHPAAIQFHHICPSEKEGDISRMMNSNSSKRAILREISKCISVCANCHCVLHAGEDVSAPATISGGV